MIELDIQRAFEAANGDSMLPADAELESWVNGALKKYQKPFELTIRIVGIDESQALNHQYRNKDKPTNVLSFPFEIPEGVDLNLLGDIVVCAPVVEQEAKEQNKMRTAHWAHMIVHGCLHLLGYDHISDSEAEEMESLEIDILAELGFNNPYEEI